MTRPPAEATEAAPPRAASACRRRLPTRPRPTRGFRPTCSSAAGRQAEGVGGEADAPGGGVAVQDKVSAVVSRSACRWRRAGRCRSRWSHAATVDRRQVRLDPRRQGAAGRQGPHVAAPAGGRVRRRAGVHGVHVPVLDLGQRPVAAALATPTRPPTRRRRRGTSSVSRNCSRCSTRWSPASPSPASV